MPLSKCIHTEWDAGEAMRLRQILIEREKELVLKFYHDPEARMHPLLYNIHVKNINDTKNLIRRIEEPLVEQGYLDQVDPEYLIYLPLGGNYSYRLREDGT